MRQDAIAALLFESLVRVPDTVVVDVQTTRLLQRSYDVLTLELRYSLRRRLTMSNLLGCDFHDGAWSLDLVDVFEVVIVLCSLLGTSGKACDQYPVVLPLHVHLHAARVYIAPRPVALALACFLAAVIAPDATVELLRLFAATGIPFDPEIINVRPQSFPVGHREHDLRVAQLK